MLDRNTILALIPHQGSMCLLDRILDWSEARIRLATATHRSPDNPLRSGGQLRAVHLCEYGAQAMAVHGGLSAARAVAPRVLVSVRHVQLHVGRVDPLEGELLVEAVRLMDGGSSWQYAFRVLHDERLLAEGRAAVMARSASSTSSGGGDAPRLDD